MRTGKRQIIILRYVEDKEMAKNEKLILLLAMLIFLFLGPDGRTNSNLVDPR